MILAIRVGMGLDELIFLLLGCLLVGIAIGATLAHPIGRR